MLEHDSDQLSISVKHLRGTSQGTGLKVSVIVSEFNTEITQGLLDGCLSTLGACGVRDLDITLIVVPGAVELSSTASKVSQSLKIDAIVCLGAVIRGATSHFDFVCHSVTQGVTTVSIQQTVPVVFGILTTDTVDQAKERSSNNNQNKGAEAAITAIKMGTLFKSIDERL